MQKKDCVPIKYCRLCNSKKINGVFEIGSTPLANSYSNKSTSEKLRVKLLTERSDKEFCNILGCQKLKIPDFIVLNL